MNSVIKLMKTHRHTGTVLKYKHNASKVRQAETETFKQLDNKQTGRMRERQADRYTDRQ